MSTVLSTTVFRMVLRGFLSLVSRSIIALSLLLVVTLFCVGLAIQFEAQYPSKCTFGPQGQILTGGLLRECKAEVAQHNVEWANKPAMNFTFYVIWPAMLGAIGFWFFQGLVYKRSPSTTREETSPC